MNAPSRVHSVPANGIVEITLPLHLVSVANIREHWATRAHRTSTHRNLARMALRTSVGDTYKVCPLTVTLTRIAPRQLDDDNLQSACKGLRDGVADALGIKDNDPRVRWEYSQAKRKPKEYAVVIRLEGRAS